MQHVEGKKGSTLRLIHSSATDCRREREKLLHYSFGFGSEGSEVDKSPHQLVEPQNARDSGIDYADGVDCGLTVNGGCGARAW